MLRNRNVSLNHKQGRTLTQTQTHCVRRSFPHGVSVYAPTKPFFPSSAVRYEVPMWPSQRQEGSLVQRVSKINYCWMFQTGGISPLTHIYIQSSSIIPVLGKRARAAVETCQLPFTSTEECWRVFTMLSVSAPDKSSQFINKIDGIAYHQFLLCVFPYKPLCQKHLRYLTRSYPLCPSPGLLRCFNIFPIQLSVALAGCALTLFRCVWE